MGEDGAVQLVQRPDILGSQDVVGGGEEGGPAICLPGCLQGSLPGGGERQPLRQAVPQGQAVGFRLLGQQVRRPLQGADVPGFTPEGEGGDHAQPVEDLRAAGGKLPGGGEGVGEGELQHQVSPGEQGHPGPDMLPGHGGFPPLDVVPAHDHHQVVGVCLPPGLGQVVAVPRVQGVVFGDDSSNVHRHTPLHGLYFNRAPGKSHRAS